MLAKLARSTLLALSLMLAANAPAQPRAAAPPATLPAAGEITLFQSPRRVIVLARIGGGDPMPLVFDTGSDGNTIDAAVTRRLRLKRITTVEEVDGTTGKRRLLPGVRLPDVTLGGLRVGSLKAVSVAYDRSDAMGIVSPEVFTDSLLWLDLANSRAVLVSRATTPLPLGRAAPYVAAIPTIDLVMPDGSTLPAHFDSGFDGALSLPVALMDKVPLVAPARVVGRFKSINTEGEVYGGRIKGRIRIGPVVLDGPEVTFLGDLANIGLPIMRQLTLVIDPAGDRSWVLPTGAKPPAPLIGIR